MLNIKIEGISNLGQGFAFDEDNKKRKIFVPKTVTGDVISGEVIKKNNKFTLARADKIITASKFRQEAECEYFEKCGGCSLQHLKDDFYQEYKKKIVTETLSRAEVAQGKEVKWVWIGDKSRRRVNFHVNPDNQLGFYKENSNELVRISHCLMLEAELSALIEPLQTKINTLPHNLIKQISACKFDNGIDMVLDLVEEEPSMEITTGLVIFAKNNNIINLSYKIGEDITTIYRPSAPHLDYGHIKTGLPSGVFLQASKKGQEAIINEILSVTDNDKSIENAVDLYCGIGTYTFCLKNLKKIDAFEGIESMTDSINSNVAKNNLSSQIKAYTRDLVLNPLQANELKECNLALINPPRNGAKAQVSNLAKSQVPNIIMVSCNLNSFTKDMKILEEAGYKVEKITAIDQFYYTHHVELVAHLKK